LVLCVFIDKLLVVGNKGLRDCLTDGVDLGSMSTTGNADADIDAGELVEADNQEGLVELLANVVRKSPTPHSHLISRTGRIYLEAEDLWLDQVEGLAVNLDKALSGLDR
jgi:hypothetical protein